MLKFKFISRSTFDFSFSSSVIHVLIFKPEHSWRLIDEWVNFVTDLYKSSYVLKNWEPKHKIMCPLLADYIAASHSMIMVWSWYNFKYNVAWVLLFLQLYSFDFIPRAGALKFLFLSGKMVCTYLICKEDFIDFVLLLKMLKSMNPETKEKRNDPFFSRG